ncbi:MAG: hypothetical protein ACTTKJ_01475 [Prevotella koreensis]|uniref:hypothetical protein n=1 Tax=Prevotella koreensis TaxID=2490854 RepID=UPI003F9EBE77
MVRLTTVSSVIVPFVSFFSSFIFRIYFNAHRSTPRSAPTGNAFKAKRRKNAQRSTLIPHRSSLNTHRST